MPSLEVLIGIGQILPQSALFQPKKSQFSQSFPLREMFHPPQHLCTPFLHPLQQVPVLPELETPELDPVLQIWPHQGIAEGKDNFP